MTQLLRFLRLIFVDWLPALIDVCRRLYRWKKREPRDPSRVYCHPIDRPAFVRPEPTIYDQYWLTKLGLAVTWDNPDIQLYRAGVPVSSTGLEPGVTYDVTARVWNNSHHAPVVDLPVRFSYLEFGIGTVSNPIGVAILKTLGVKGGANHPAFVTMPWTTPTTPGHYCLQVKLEPVDDLNPDNNRGQENTDVAVAQSPAVFEFKLENRTPGNRRYRFEVDAYRLDTVSPCTDRREDRLARHRRGLHTVPAGWQVKLDPETPSLAAGASVGTTVTVTPPTGWTGTQPLNVNAFNEASFAGGVTLLVKSS